MIIIELLENINEIGEKIRNIDFKEMQENFLESTIGKIANSALDTGLKSLLPDFLEKEIIDVKDTILKEGFSEGVNKAIETATNLGKSAMGIFTGNFESIEQAEKVLEKGGLLETISDGLDYVIEKLEDSKIISNNISDLIKSGKDLIINMLDNDIKNEFLKEKNSLSNIENYFKEWENNYLAKNIEGLNINYEKIKNKIEEILPLENTYNNIQKIENINELINNSNNFNFDPVYLDLAKNV